MRILLITTSDNEVRDTLQKIAGVELSVIDCATHTSHSRENMEVSFFSELETSFAQDVFPDVIITYRCPFIIPRDIYSKACLGAYNIHPSLLPKYRGLNPWDEIFRNKESKTGVTIHQMSESIDDGPIVLQSSFMIEESDTIDTSRMKSDQHAAQLVNQLINIITKVRTAATLLDYSAYWKDNQPLTL